MATYHQSDLAAMARCMAADGYARAGVPDQTNSAAAFGSVMHAALQVLERERATGTPFAQAVADAIETFVHFWLVHIGSFRTCAPGRNVG